MILIYGKGKVGSALAAFCDYLGICYDIKDDQDGEVDFSLYDTIIPSPGIKPSHPLYTTGKVKGELDFVFDYLPKDFVVVGVTGTDGKSTTSWILHELFAREYGAEKVFLSGNFDIPFCATVQEILQKGLKDGYIVLEVSSFMAYNIRTFRPTYSIFTNLSFDHLNWHADMSDYLGAKLNLIKNTTKKAYVNNQILLDYPEAISASASVIPFWHEAPDYSVNYPSICLHGISFLEMDQTKFSGVHNAFNLLSAALVAQDVGMPLHHIKLHFATITGLPHRLEEVGIISWVRFIDDSKSTSAQSLKAAIESFSQKIILIAGGSDKGDPFLGLEESFAVHLKHAEFIGQTKEILGAIAQKSDVPFHYSASMEEAVQAAFSQAQQGDLVVLSPGCASFDMFKDYLDRAHKFRDAVKQLSA